MDILALTELGECFGFFFLKTGSFFFQSSGHPGTGGLPKIFANVIDIYEKYIAQGIVFGQNSTWKSQR